MSHTLTETGMVLTETREGVTMPADYSFANVNDFVHGLDTHYEDLQYLCLGMATHIEMLQRGALEDIEMEIIGCIGHDGECCKDREQEN